jgi:adenosylhomocysteine nucleosidase
MTATTLVEKFGVTHILFTGVAGAGDASIRVGDIVVAESLVQHDMDASPLFPRYEVPLTGLSHFASDRQLALDLAAAARHFLETDFVHAIDPQEKAVFALQAPRVHQGLVGSGDQFVSDGDRIQALSGALPGLLAVEMEGAAVAQACADFGRPFAVVRTISDRADDAAHVDFARFIEEVASATTRAIIEEWLRHQANSLDASSPVR